MSALCSATIPSKSVTVDTNKEGKCTNFKNEQNTTVLGRGKKGNQKDIVGKSALMDKLLTSHFRHTFNVFFPGCVRERE